MMIKKLLFLFLFLCISGICFAQIKWDIQAGLDYSNITAKDRDGNQAQTSAVSGIRLGLGANIPLFNRWAVHPALVYAKRGFQQDGAPSHIGWGKDFKAVVSYIELPVDLLYLLKIGPGNLSLAAGPYIGYGTGGRWATEGSVLIGDIRIDSKGDVAFQNDNSYGDMNTYAYAKPWDYGVHFEIGYILFDHYSLSLEMQQGIADLQPRFGDYKPKSSVRNKSWGISLGYWF